MLLVAGPTVLFFVLMVGLVLLVAVIGILAWQQEKKRREALRAIAAREGWSFQDKDTRDIPKRYEGFEPFGQGHTRYAFNIMRGRYEEAPFELFDYHYAVTTSNGKSSQTHHYYHRVCMVEMPLASPGLSIKDEHLGHKIMDALGGEDIDFESDEFSRRFWVRCPDRRFAYDVIHTGMMEYLLPLRKWTWQWRGTWLVVVHQGKLRPADVRSTLALAQGFRARVPRHLLPQTAAPARSWRRA